jgi:hypothetical protein
MSKQTTKQWEMSRIQTLVEDGDTQEALAVAEEAFALGVFSQADMRCAEQLIGE